jgi:hypothetical protein
MIIMTVILTEQERLCTPVASFLEGYRRAMRLLLRQRLRSKESLSDGIVPDKKWLGISLFAEHVIRRRTAGHLLAIFADNSILKNSATRNAPMKEQAYDHDKSHIKDFANDVFIK